MSDAQSRQMNFEEYKKADILTKLTFWRDLPHGTLLDNLGFPDRWDEPIREMCREAHEEITFLRSVSGAVSRGPSFEDYAKRSK